MWQDEGMSCQKTVFAQLMEQIHPEQFRRCVCRYGAEDKARKFSHYDQFLAMAYAQLSSRESLSDIELSLQSHREKLYRAGFHSSVHHSTLSDANNSRDWRIYEDLAKILIPKAQRAYAGQTLCGELKNIAYALDSTTIDLCLSLFPWARFRKTKAAVKLHTLINLRGLIPVFISITDGKRSDVSILDDLVFEPGSFYVMDRGYLDFKRLHKINLSASYFVIRGRAKLKFTKLKSLPVKKEEGIISDKIVRPALQKSFERYPDRLRRIHFFDDQTQKHLVFLSNNFDLPATTIAQLYKYRWRIEIFFKWIKQNLHIKHFFGNSINAVKTQIWISICVFLILALLKKQLLLPLSPSQILQILSTHLFDQVPIQELLTNTSRQLQENEFYNQLSLNGF